MTSEPSAFLANLNVLRQQRLAATPAPPEPEYDVADAPTLDEADISPERADLDQILAHVDILKAYRIWCGKMNPEVGSKREGIMISCPNPAHRDSNPSAWINLDQQVYFCGGCQEGGDKFTIAALSKGISYENNPDEFVRLKREMAGDLGWTPRRTLGGQKYYAHTGPEPVGVVEDTQGSETSDPVSAPAPDSNAGGDNASATSLATVTALPVTQPDEDLIPEIAWKKMIPNDTFLHRWCSILSGDDLPEEFYFWLGLQAIGGAAGRDVTLFDIPPVYGNLFVCLLGPTGMGKTRSSFSLLDLAHNALSYDYSDPNSTGLKTITSPASAETLIDSFSVPVYDPANPKSIAYYSKVRGLVRFDELAGLVGRANRVGNPLKPTLMEFYDMNNTVEVSSRGHGRVVAFDPFCSLLSTTQPNSIRRLMGHDDVDSGFMNRWVFAMGPSKPPQSLRLTTLDISPTFPMIQELKAWCSIGRQLAWTDQARVYWDAFFQDQVYPDKTSDEAGLLTRVDLTLKKLMLLYSINEKRSQVDLDVVERACQMYPYLTMSYEYVGGKMSSGIMEDIRKAVVDALTKGHNGGGKGMTLRDITRRFPRNHGFPVDKVSRVIKAMIDLGQIDEIVSEKKGPGGNPIVKYSYVA